MVAGSSTAGGEARGDRLSRDELVRQYDAYRRRQARGLIRLLPDGAIRPLLRRALEEGSRERGASDPLNALLRYCERLLPLPPFEAWLEDVASHPVAHLRDVDDSAEVPTAEAPVTVETRCFTVGELPWLAHLRSFRDGMVWRGYIAFEDHGSHRVHRTALIFRETDPVEVRERFLTFDHTALTAFLRSTLP